MTHTYCTLFNRNYLDKGVVMIRSLCKKDPLAQVTVLCMDEDCFHDLQILNLEHTYLLNIEKFVDSDLKRVREERTAGEFCFTCTAKLLQYMFSHTQEEIITYVDSDLYFYNDPYVLVEEMLEDGKSVQVISHRFLDNPEGREFAARSGRNCVQFNTFKRCEDALNLLDQWASLCIAECKLSEMGDQFYTDAWGDLPFVSVSRNGGAGVAPWNLHRYRSVIGSDNKIYDRYDRKTYELIFFHYSSIMYLSRTEVYILPPKQHICFDVKLCNRLYGNYVDEIETVKAEIEKKCGFLPLRVVTDEMLAEKHEDPHPEKKRKSFGMGQKIRNRYLQMTRTKACHIHVHQGESS